MLLKIYLKEIKDSFRDRRTLLLTVFLPIIMMSGMTFFYEKIMSGGGEETYTLAVNDTISAEEEKLFSSNENINLVKSSEPEELLQEGEAQAVLKLSPDFMNSIANGEEASATLLGDSFSTNSSFLMSIVSNILAEYEKMVVADRLQKEGTDLQLIQPFTVIQEEISEDNTGVGMIAFLIPLILIVAISAGASPAAAEMFAGEKEKKTMEALLMTPVNRLTLLVAKWLTIATLGAFTGIITLIVVAVEIYFFTENLKNAVVFGDNAFIVILLAILMAIVFAILIATLLMLTSIIAKTVKESGSYSSPVMMVGFFPAMIIINVGIHELSFTHFAVPFLNMYSIFKELLYGVVNYEHILIAILSNLVCIVIAFIIARILFLKDKWVMN